MQIFDELPIRSFTLSNRIVVSPMCQYSSTDGFANDWHLVHLGSRAVGGVALVIAEATAVTPEGRISPNDLGIWKDEHIEPLARITKFIRGQKVLPGIQIAHAGRKASTPRPWEGSGSIPKAKGGWTPVAPSDIPFDEHHAHPVALDEAGIRRLIEAFAAAAGRALAAGFQVLEIHGAHGYLIHEFLSPVSNLRTDSYGGSFDNRTRFLREVVSAVRRVWPESHPLFVRISASDWVEEGWEINQSIDLVRQLIPLGVDVIDCSSGGIVPGVHIPARPGFQVPFAKEIRDATGILTAAVGLIDTPALADEILNRGDADLVVLARELLRHPYWPLDVARQLGFRVSWPVQYLRAAPPDTPAR
ncbi:MAG TPA: NADH:flavin oxidoreductase/NADH oxidase [Candidatus Acidoferrum sp.]|nr:NADH:flavin oxidoreductase/NADH oxidase [Candidatus Acidoferrum sp.]